MKQIQKEVKSYKTMYVANDGTEFSNAEECEKYDESAKGVIFAKYKKLVIGEGTECDLFGCADEDRKLEIVKPTCEKDKDTIMQMSFFVRNDTDEKLSSCIDRAINDNDVLFIDWNYDNDWCWCVGTPKTINEKMSKFVQDFTTKDDVELK